MTGIGQIYADGDRPFDKYTPIGTGDGQKYTFSLNRAGPEKHIIQICLLNDPRINKKGRPAAPWRRPMNPKDENAGTPIYIYIYKYEYIYI